MQIFADPDPGFEIFENPDPYAGRDFFQQFITGT